MKKSKRIIAVWNELTKKSNPVQEFFFKKSKRHYYVLMEAYYGPRKNIIYPPKTPIKSVCEGVYYQCNETEGLELESSRTFYYWNGFGNNPNSDITLCRACAKLHHEHWDDIWNEYYSDQF